MKSVCIWFAIAPPKHICVCIYMCEYLVDMQIKLANRRELKLLCPNFLLPKVPNLQIHCVL